MNIDKWKVKLCLEALYYYSAQDHYKKALKSYKPLGDVIDTIITIDKKIKMIENKYENKLDAYEEVESYCIQLDSYYSEMDELYIPIIKDLSLVHIFNSLCLEAFINISAINNLSSFLKDFNRLNIHGKWLFLPLLMRKKRTFEKEKEPFKGFLQINNWRNKLVHYKGIWDEWRSYRPPLFFKSLGLTIQDAEKSCTTVKKMIETLCCLCEIENPNWLNTQYWSLFEYNETGK